MVENGQKAAAEEPRRNAQQNRDGDAGQIRKGQTLTSRQTGERGKQDDDEHIVHRSPRHDHLGDATCTAPAVLYEPEHFGDDHRGGDGGHHTAQKSRLQRTDAELGSQQHHPHQLEAGGKKAHQ